MPRSENVNPPDCVRPGADEQVRTRGGLLHVKKYPKYPKASFRGKLDGFTNGAPHRPVVLTFNSFKCMPPPMFKRDWCGADAQTVINREEFGMPMGKDYGIKMEVALRIQVEAVATK